VESDGDGFGRAEAATRGAGLGLRDGDGDWGYGDGEGFHAKGVGAVRVFEDGAADALLTDEGADAGEGDVEAGGLGKLRGEEAELDFAGVAGIRGEGDGEDGGGGRVRLEVEMEETEPESAVVIRERGADGAGVSAAAFERERDGDGGEGENLCGGADDEVVEEDTEDEEERVEEFDRGVELDAFFEGEGRVGGDEEMRGLASGELTEAAAFLAEAGDEFFFGQRGEGAEGGDAPAGEGFCVFGSEREDGEREWGEDFLFFSGRDDGGANRHAAGEAEGGVEVGADDDGGVDSEDANRLQELLGELFGRADEFFGSGNVENHPIMPTPGMLGAPAPEELTGLMFVIFSIAVAAAEAAVGLAIVINIAHNRRTLNVEQVDLLKF